MIRDEQVLIFRLIGLRGYDKISSSEFLDAMGANDGVQLGLLLLTEAIAQKSKDDVSLAMSVCYAFGYEAIHLPLLHELVDADWHDNHEDVASALDYIGSDESVPYLKHLAEWVPTDLMWDDARALSTKAIWGLGKMGTPAARAAILELAQSGDAHVVQEANFQVKRLGLGG